MSIVLTPGNKRTLYVAVQDDKDTPATEPTLMLRVRNFQKNPVRQIIALEETDRSAQEGGSVVVGVTPGGSFDHYLRPNECDLLLYALLGAADDDGGPVNFTHTLTPDQDSPYLTIWELEPGLWCNRFVGVRLTQGTVSGGAGQPLEITGLQFEAIAYTAGEAEPVTPETPVDELPYIYPEVAVTRGVTHDGSVDAFTVVVNRNGKRAQGDNGFASLDYANGKWQVSGQITQYLTSEDDLRATDTGDPTGTDPTQEIQTDALSILVERDADTSVEIAMTKVSLTTATAGVNTDGSPLTQVLAFRTEPTEDIDDNLTVTVLNQVAQANHETP